MQEQTNKLDLIKIYKWNKIFDSSKVIVRELKDKP